MSEITKAYEKIKQKVKQVGKMRSGKEGILITSIEKFAELAKKYYLSKLPVEVWCGTSTHEYFITIWDRLKQNKWCRQCYDDKRVINFYKIEKKVKELGLKKTGKAGILITNREEFEDSIVNIIPSLAHVEVWCGISNHEYFITNWDRLNQNKWCRQCYIDSRKIKYNQIELKVRDLGLKKSGREGILQTSFEEFAKITEKIKPSKAPVEVWCGDDKHESFITIWDYLNQEKWCRKCYDESLIKYTFSFILKLIDDIGLSKTGIKGKLLNPKSEIEFLRLGEKLKKPPSLIPLIIWCGILDHDPFETNGDRLNQWHWCPLCSQNEYERICRWYFEQIFKSKFPNTKISQILPSYKGNMHLDGYSVLIINGVRIKLAFEFNGIQHDEFPNYFHKTYQEFVQQQMWDREKEDLCNKNGIILTIVPQKIDINMSHPDIIQNYIIREFEQKTGITLPIMPQYVHRNFANNNRTIDDYI